MKVAAPIRSTDELEALVAAGAEEVYVGFVPAAWVESQRPDQWMNRREPRGANLHGLSELRELVRHAHASNVRVSLTVNAQRYEPAQMPLMLRMAGHAAELGVDALVLADIGYLLELRRRSLPIRLHFSSVGTCTNREAAALLEDLGVARVILPRHLSVREIASIVHARPRLEFEAFLLNDGCAYEEGLCLTSHHYGPICLTAWRAELRPLSGRAAGLEKRWPENQEAYQEYLWYLNNCGSSIGPGGVPIGPCGLCALLALRVLGIDAVKVVGREASLARKVASVRLARAVLDRLRAGASDEAAMTAARELRASPEVCRTTYACYYRS
jgi:collagenase-like PrtC family protease